MSSFMKIAAMFALSSPLALAGCLAGSESTDANDPAAQPQDASDALCTYAEPAPTEPCPAKTFNPPTFGAPETPSPLYPAPHFGAPTHEAPVYKAPAYEGPTYQNPGQVPVITAPVYEAPMYPGPVFKAPVYEAPVYDAPTFPAPIYERATYGECKTIPARDLGPCVQVPASLPGGAIIPPSGEEVADESSGEEITP